MFEVESSLVVKAGLALGLVQISSAMYNCLVYYTGGYTVCTTVWSTTQVSTLSVQLSGLLHR